MEKWLAAMLVFSIGGPILFVVGILFLILYKKNDSDFCLCIGVLGSIFSFLGCIVFIPTTISNYIEAKKEYASLVVNIVSLDRDTGVYGRFCLGTGTVEDKPIYYYYYKVKENTYKLGKINCKECFIVETEEYQPSIWKIKEYTRVDYYYNIYVPFGTVIVSYSA